MSLHRSIIIALCSMGAIGCATADRVQQLEEKVAALEKKVEEVEKSGPRTAKVDTEAEAKAKAVYEELTAALQKGDIDTAKAKLDELKTKYGSTTTYKRASKVAAELEVIGKAAPSDWKSDVETWYQGENDFDLSSGTNLLVFWEVWCPHCRREVPNLKETYDKFKGQGLQVAGFTKITRSATEEKVKDFIKEQEIGYSIAKENGELSKYFNVSGIPAAAVVKDGKIVWRGHPGRLNDDMIKGWL